MSMIRQWAVHHRLDNTLDNAVLNFRTRKWRHRLLRARCKQAATWLLHLTCSGYQAVCRMLQILRVPLQRCEQVYTDKALRQKGGKHALVCCGTVPFQMQAVRLCMCVMPKTDTCTRTRVICRRQTRSEVFSAHLQSAVLCQRHALHVRIRGAIWICRFAPASESGDGSDVSSLS